MFRPLFFKFSYEKFSKMYTFYTNNTQSVKIYLYVTFLRNNFSVFDQVLCVYVNNLLANLYYFL